MSELVDKIILGTAQFGMNYGIANQNGQISEDEIKKILDLAWNHGIKTLDSAKVYGNSEEQIAKYLTKNTKNTWIIITKFTHVDTTLSNQIKYSTNKLTTKPSIVLAHSAKLFLDDKFQKELSYLKRNYSLKIGVSLYTKEEIYQVLNSNIKPDVIQLPMNILDTRLHRNGALDKIYENGVEIHVRSVFLQGLFYLSEDQISKHFIDVLPYLKKMKSIAKKSNLTLSELSLLWLTSLRQVSKVIIGVDNSSQLKSHIETLNKNVGNSSFDEILSIHYENNNILNPSLWPSKY